MMASHGRGQRIGLGRKLGWAALVGVSLGGPAGRAQACHIRHWKPGETGASHGTPTVESQQILNPTSMVPQLPPLAPSAATPPATAPAITPTSASAPVTPATPSPLVPSMVANPPAAETIPAPTAPTDVSAWQNTGTPACTCTCPVPPPGNVPVIYPPDLPGGTSPLQPPAAGSITTPEPSTILSAALLVGGTVLWRRRARTR